MAKKRHTNPRKTAEKFAAIALRHLSQYSEEEQEERISRAERTVANALLTPSVEIGTSLSARRQMATEAPQPCRLARAPTSGRRCPAAASSTTFLARAFHPAFLTNIARSRNALAAAERGGTDSRKKRPEH